VQSVGGGAAQAGPHVGPHRLVAVLDVGAHLGTSGSVCEPCEHTADSNADNDYLVPECDTVKSQLAIHVRMSNHYTADGARDNATHTVSISTATLVQAATPDLTPTNPHPVGAPRHVVGGAARSMHAATAAALC
jgi:hypothetical protein